MAALAYMSIPRVAEVFGSSGKGGGLEAHSPEAWEIHHGCSWWHLGSRGEAAYQPSRNGRNIDQCAGNGNQFSSKAHNSQQSGFSVPCVTR